jgi:hypothetical protein
MRLEQEPPDDIGTRLLLTTAAARARTAVLLLPDRGAELPCGADGWSARPD